MILVAVAWLAAAALAFTPGEPLVLQVVGGVEISGNFRTTDGEEVTLVVDGQPLTLDLALVESALRGGQVVDTHTLQAEADAWVASQVPPGPQPHPALVGAASALLPGAGHLLLSDRRTWAGYAVVDASLLALAGWFAFHEQAPKATVTLLVIDGVFRLYAVTEAVRDARRRRPAGQAARAEATRPCRAAVSLAPLPGGGVAAAGGFRCGGPARLEEIGLIH